MGIKGLTPFLKKYAPYSFGQITLDKLRGTRIAIDTLNLIFRTYPNARKKVINRTDVTRKDPSEPEIFKEWMNNLFDIIRILTSYSITPVFVFDGERPKEKSETNRKRGEDRLKTKNKMLNLREEIRNMDPLLITPEMVTKLRKLMINTNDLSFDSISEFKSLLTKLGIPNIQAKYEGEQLCAMYAKEGIVSAVYSTDTDNLAYGVPLLIKNIGNLVQTPRGYVFTAQCVWYENVLKQLKYTPEKFLDLCIMSGCDYNTNIKGIGVNKAYGLFKSYNSIDDIPRMEGKDFSVLKHERCREMFQDVSSDSLFVNGFLDYKKEKLPLLGPSLEELMIFSNQKYLLRSFDNLDRPSEKIKSIPSPPEIPEIKKYNNVILRIVSH